MSSLNCTCEYIQDRCRYNKPPDPPPNYNVEYIEAFRNSLSGWKKYKEECLHSTATPTTNDNFFMTSTEGGTFTLAASRVQKDSGLSTGALIGIVIAVIVCTLIIIIVVVYLVTQPKKRQKLWIKSRSMFQSKVKINKGDVQLTLQKYEEVNFLHSKAVKGECYKNESFSSEDNTGSNTDTVFDGAYTDSNCNQNHSGSNQLTSLSIYKNEISPASDLPYNNIPPSKICLTIAEINSAMTQLSSDKAKDCIKEQDKTWDDLEEKKPRKKKNHLKRHMDNSKSDLVDNAESLWNENK